MSIFDFRVVSERKQQYNIVNTENSITNTYVWTKQMTDYSNGHKMTFYKDNESKNVSKIKNIDVIDSRLQGLSQKVMKQTWDNQEDEFWNTY